MGRAVASLIALALAAALWLPAQSATGPAERLYSPAELVDAAAIHASKLDRKTARFARYVALHSIPHAQRAKRLKLLGYVMNSLSRSDVIALPTPVTADLALAHIDLSACRIDPAVFDRLGRLGSGAAPFPEPFFHSVSVRKVTLTRPGKYRRSRLPVRRTRKVVALSPALNRATAVGLAELTKSNFPIFEFRWLVANATVEPRYHELLGLDDSEKSVLRLAVADERTADRVGAQTRATVLFSEVGERNRILERTPTPLAFGRGTFQRSFDFKTSIKLQNAIDDLLLVKADAHELIWTLPNGLQGFYVSDGNGRRLDKADADVALDGRTRLRDKQVRTARNCMTCHLSERGWMETDDEATAFARSSVTLLADAVAKRDRRRGERVRQKYLATDHNALLRADQGLVEAAVRAATGGKDGLSCAETGGQLADTLLEYLDRPLTAELLARELGVTEGVLLATIERNPGLDNVLTGLRIGRKQRRDQVEVAFSKIATVLYLGK